MRAQRIEAFATLMLMACAGGCNAERVIEAGEDLSQATAALDGHALLQEKSPTINYNEGMDFIVFINPRPAGLTIAPMTAVNAGVNESGCDPSDFDNFPPGQIALVRRGSCVFETKALNAQEAGASGLLVFNNVPGLPDLPVSFSGEPVVIPALFLTQELGNHFVELSSSGKRVLILVTPTSERSE